MVFKQKQKALKKIDKYYKILGFGKKERERLAKSFEALNTKYVEAYFDNEMENPSWLVRKVRYNLDDDSGDEEVYNIEDLGEYEYVETKAQAIKKAKVIAKKEGYVYGGVVYG
jgi:hypothetical protein